MTNQDSKKMGLIQCTSLVTGNLIGSGVFMLPALLAAYGSPSIIGWVITSMGATFLALIFAALSERIHDCNGGPHVFIKEAFGKEAGFWAAWGYWVLTWSSNTALLVTATSYLAKIKGLIAITGPLSSMHLLSLQLALWAAVTLINLFGVKNAARFELAVTILKIIPIIGIPVGALYYIKWGHFVPFMPADSSMHLGKALEQSVFLTLWAFIGVESATVPSQEVDNPEKTVGRATIIGTALASVVYILGSVAAIGVLGNAMLAKSAAPYADLASQIFGGNWADVIASCAVISCVGAFNGWTLVVARIAQGAAEQGLFPEIFAKKDAKGTPIMSILIASSCTLISILFTINENMLSQFNTIVEIAVTLILLMYLASVTAYFKIIKPKTVAAISIGIGAGIFVLFGLYASGLTKIGAALLLLMTGLVFRQNMHKRKDVLAVA